MTPKGSSNKVKQTWEHNDSVWLIVVVEAVNYPSRPHSDYDHLTIEYASHESVVVNESNTLDHILAFEFALSTLINIRHKHKVKVCKTKRSYTPVW